ncbi:hypothetical protein DH2020_028897 [Rehmannia glutinosa]|uniref:Membrane-associated kinase regulator 2 n=1 Tax=Rehmannia glutinosa TaxID=99300 RepID=A0ABR0VQZ3_REHGL
MEGFSLLKYWRSSGGGGGGGSTTTVVTADSTANARATTKTIVTAAVSPDSSDSEDGPYFDLEFTLPDDADEEPQSKNDQNAPETEIENETESVSDDAQESSEHENDDDDEEEEDELKLAVTSNDCTEQSVTLSPSDELFFKGNLVSIEPSSILLNGSNEENSKLPVFLVKSATKFRVLLLKLKKSKSSNGENIEKPEKSEKDEKESQGKLMGVFRPLERRRRFQGCVAPPCAAEKVGEGSNVKTQTKQGNNSNLQAGLKVVRKHLGKSRSASAAVAAAPPGKTASNRRDDSLLQVQDGIQGAILHCKKSFNASRDVESSSILCRSVSDPSYEKSIMMPKASRVCSSSSFSGEAKQSTKV